MTRRFFHLLRQAVVSTGQVVMEAQPVIITQWKCRQILRFIHHHRHQLRQHRVQRQAINVIVMVNFPSTMSMDRVEASLAHHTLLQQHSEHHIMT